MRYLPTCCNTFGLAQSPTSLCPSLFASSRQNSVSEDATIGRFMWIFLQAF